jgi:hypothetical protein
MGRRLVDAYDPSVREDADTSPEDGEEGKESMTTTCSAATSRERYAMPRY